MERKVAVYGIYSTQDSVERAVEVLRDNNFRNADISVLFPGPDTTRAFAHTNATKFPEGAMYGGASGVVVGGALGWLVGLGLIAIPGVGPFVAAGPIMSFLAGAGAGSIIGGVSGALIGLGIPEYEAERYAGRIKNGGILLSVHAENEQWRDKAKRLLEQTGAQDVSASIEAPADYQPPGSVVNY